MIERKITEEDDSGIMLSMKILGGKWKACIIDVISKGAIRPSEIYRLIPEASTRVIEMQLKELIDLGIVTKDTCGGFPLCTDYVLTDIGKSTLPLISAIENWGNEYKDAMFSKEKSKA